MKTGTKQAEILVVGAGAIGSYIALKLARSGHKVVVIEKKKDVSARVCCTGIVSPSCLKLVPINVKRIELNYINCHFPNRAKYVLKRRVYIVDRPALNQNLMEEAEKAGVKYYLGTPYNKDAHKADITIMAWGYHPSSRSKTLIGTQYEVSSHPDEINIYLEKKGYGWVVPTPNGKGFVGSLGIYDLSGLLKEKNIIDKQVKATPAGLTPKTHQDNTLSVGECAGQIKTTTGGGLHFGFVCADIAVKVINERLPFSEYDKRWKKKIGFNLRKGIIAWRLFRCLPIQASYYIFSLFKSFGEPI